MKTKNLRIIFLLLVGILSTLPLQAEEYHKTITVLQQGQVIPVEEFHLTTLLESELSRVRVKNGGSFFVKLPQNHNIRNLMGGVLEGENIRVENPGTLRFFFTKNGEEKKLYADVNYFGVLQYQGSDAPDEIEVTQENENAVLSVPAEKFAAFGWFWFGEGEDEEEPFSSSGNISLSNLLATRRTNFVAKFNDGTSNAIPDGTAGGYSEDVVRLIDKRTIAPVISTPSLPEGVKGEEYSFQLKAEGTAPISWAVVSGSLPTGLSLSNEGLISGTPNQNGTFTFVVKASNQAGAVQKEFELVIKEKDLAPPTSFKLLATYQRDAIISWQRGANETEWEISYGDRKVIVTEPRLTLKGLSPNTDYEITVRAKSGENFSEPLEGKIKTEDLTKTHNRLPHLYGMKEVFSVKEVLPIFWKDLEKVPKKISYSLSPLSTSKEKVEKIFLPIPEAISFSEKGSFILTLRFEGHDECEEDTFLIEVK